jgi:CRP-like cAMP-binding protein
LPSIQYATTSNCLLDSLPANDLRALLVECETVNLAQSERLYAPMERLSHVYFPVSGFIALIMAVDGSDSLEVGLIGNEGMLGIPLALGVGVSVVSAVVLGAGSALRVESARFCREFEGRQALRSEIDRYVFVRLSQLAQAVACMRFHVVEARLARWLLMAQDRAHTDTLHITQELLASMLGVRRVGVTKAASSLLKRGLIRYARGDITVLDRRGLRASACGCYSADRESYDRILGTSLRGSRGPVPRAKSVTDDHVAAGIIATSR